MSFFLPLRPSMGPKDWNVRCLAQQQIDSCYGNINRVAGKAECEDQKFSVSEHGYCYLRMFRREWQARAAEEFGSHPSMDLLAAASVEWIEESVARDCRVERICGDVYHFGVGPMILGDVLASYKSEWAQLLDLSLPLVKYGRVGYGLLPGLQVFSVKVDRFNTRWFDKPIVWMAIDGREIDVSGCVDRVQLPVGTHNVSVVALEDTLISQWPIECDSTGLCYLAAIPSEERRSAFDRLGRFPSGTALQQYGGLVVGVRVWKSGESLHVTCGGDTLLGDLDLPQSVCVGGTRSTAVVAAEKIFKSSVRGLSQSVIVWLETQDRVYPGSVLLTGSCELQVTQGEVGHPPFPVNLYSEGVAVLVLPKGCKLRVGEATYGGLGIQSMFLFSGSLRGVLVPKEEVEVTVVDCVVLTALDTTLGQVYRELLDPKSTEARFMLASATSAVLRHPRVVEAGFDQYQVVQLTDPLETWAPLDTVRMQSSEVRSIGKYEQNQEHPRTYYAFRASGPTEFRLSEYVVVNSGTTVRVMWLAKTVVTVAALELNEVFDWSFRVDAIGDSYSFDGGGISDGEFSDAF